MATIPFSKLQKMKIKGYEKEDFLGTPIEYTVMYNPEKFSLQYGQDLNVNKTQAQVVSDLTSQGPTNASFSVELFFDGTGASRSGGIAAGIVGGIQALNDSFVKEEIKNFFATTFKVEGKTHTTKFLEIEWGSGFFFACKLQNATVNYMLFSKSGNPLRATVNATFLQVDHKGDENAKRTSFLSPDVTKIHTVKAGDTIYNISTQEYDSESFYLQIAQANDLKNYRKLVPGQKLILPAVKKPN
jgi:nucleoid-associated protein YgaU